MSGYVPKWHLGKLRVQDTNEKKKKKKNKITIYILNDSICVCEFVTAI